MMHGVPQPWEVILLTLAAFRLTRLIGWDDLPPIARTRDWLTGADLAGDVWTYKRPLLAHWLHCAYCLGAWASAAVWAAWLVDARWTLIVLTPFALSAAVGLIARKLDP